MLKKIKVICTVFVFSIMSSHVIAMYVEPPIHIAVIKRDFNEIRRLVEKECVDVNEKSPTYSYTPLHRAVLFYSVCRLESEKTNLKNIIHYIVEHGAQESVCTEDHRRRTPLHMELNRWNTDVELLEFLLKKGQPNEDLMKDLILYKLDKDPAVACLLKHISQEPVRVVDVEKKAAIYKVLNVWNVDIQNLEFLLQEGQLGQDLIAELIRYKSSSGDRAAIDCLLKHLMLDN